jgi:hypothetical protein
MRNIKIPKSKRKKSMIQWIISSKDMSLFQKTYKAIFFLRLKALIFLRPYSELFLSLTLVSPSQKSCKQMSRRIELLKKKHKQVQVRLMLIEKEPLHFHRELLLVLIQS